MELSKKWKRSTNWTHTKKGALCRTVSQSAIPCEQPKYPVDTNTSSDPLSQGSDPEFLHIKCNVIPHKCTNGSCQMFNNTCNKSYQIASQTMSQSVQVGISKQHVATQCYCFEFSKCKGMSKYIRDEKFWENSMNFLEQHNQLKDFISLTRGLKSGRIDPKNLSWISTLHMGRYSNCSSTTGMRYNQSLMAFYHLYYLLFGSCALNVLRGPTHFSDVVTCTCEKGKYDPSLLRINFPIPSLSAIKKMKGHYSKSAQPGLIDAMLDMFQEKAKDGKQFVLSFDGMKVSRGCKGIYDGDVNVWGIEGPPNVRSALLNLEKNTKYTSQLNRKINEGNVSIHKIQVEGIHLHLTQKLERLRKQLTDEYLLERKLENLKSNNPHMAESLTSSLCHIFQHTTVGELCK